MKDLRSEYLYRQGCRMGGFLFFIGILWLLVAGQANAQGLTAMTYNCENAFDTIHDDGKRDEEFLPEGTRHWTRHRMFEKLKNIGKVIVAADSIRPVDLVALEEVENDTVLTYLTRRTVLSALGYEYIMTHSPDQRGIDVALLYNPLMFRILHHDCIRVETSRPTRDILHVCGVTGRNPVDTIDIYVVHLPSKLGGAAGERNRRMVVEAIAASTDSVFAIRPAAKILIMGDFNDGPTSELLQTCLGKFRNLANEYGKEHGSYKYQGDWDTIDQMLISEGLVDPQNGGVKFLEAKVLILPFLLETDEAYGGGKPNRTFEGYNFHGGFSDHLPVLLKLK